MSERSERIDRLVAAVKAEHAAIYAYGVLGARLDQNTVAFAVDADAATEACLAAPSYRAALLGSIAACRASHVEALA